ncbi:MAG: T9SS type A sorting domain-containing protein [Flavobacteriales bacterium]|nr:T9SS type A sorting domain-containing protein [Flavobacteriales bacterium]
MMLIRHITAAAVLLWGIPPTLGAQSGCCPYINGIMVLPSNPTTADSLTIVFTTTTPNQGIQHYFSASQSGSILQVEACFWNGLATALKTFSDTLRLPPQPVGPYQVHYTAFATEDPNQCVPSDTNFMSISFEVTAPNSGLLPDTEQALLQIFPNPFSSQMFIQCLEEDNNVSGYFVNFDGQILAAFQFSSTSPFVFIHPGWPPGIYFLRLDFADKSVWQKVLISE